MRLEELMKMERVVDEVNEWHHCPQNVYTRDGRSLVSKVSTTGRDLKAAIRQSVEMIGGVRKALNPGDRVLLKPNLNSPDPFPAASDLPFLAAVIELLREEGITDISVGERSGWPWMPTAKVMGKLGVPQFAEEMGVKLIDFDAGPWMDVVLGEKANWWKRVAFPKALKEFDKIVYLPCLKTHFLAGFTMSLKLIVGLTHPTEMLYLHADSRFGKTDEPMFLKMLEMNLPIAPDLIIIDGRKAFVTEGPSKGEMVEPQLVLASADRIAVDAESVKVLQGYPRENLLKGNVWEMPLIRRAIKLGLGARSESEYTVLTA
ncbi:MAG TPA: DUF362 domain-containing protein [Chloroflexota bacterium]|nr:DUF362 domain-containing protein [Chloroflexota bacterium]